MIAVPSLLLLVQIGSVGGTLRDLTTGEPLAGAVVTVVDLARTTVTDADGRYRFDGVPSGSHTLLVRRIGYAPRALEALVPRDGSIEIAIALRPEPILLGAVDQMDRERPPPSPGRDRRVDVNALRDHPLLAEPDVLQGLTGGTVSLQPEAPSGLHVRGGGSDQVTYLLDGIPVFSPYHSGEAFSAWNPDALAAVELRAASETWDALSGVVAATTRTPGDRHRAQAGFSTTQMRLTLGGPLGSGRGGAGYLLSQRWAFPGFPAPDREPTYVRGETGDRLAKVEAPFAAGRIRLLGYESENELDAAGPDTIRNTFAWQSRSLGAEWRRPSGSGSLRATVWLAGANASALWNVSDSTAERLATRRNDAGVSVMMERGHNALGMRVQTSRTVYHSGRMRHDTRAPLAAVFVERRQGLGSGVDLVASLGATASAGVVRLNPRTSLSWSPTAGFTLSGDVARLHQFAQSLRNPESVAGTVFPADLSVAATRSGLPIARADQGIVAAEYRPTAAVRIAAQGYLRRLSNLVLVAPGSADPFATGGGSFAVGSGEASGVALELGATGTHVAALASYGLQHVRLRYGHRAYVPDYGVAHSADAGIVMHPSRTLSFRVGASGRFGRRATGLNTPFEWESCNVADRGCEFVGSPRTSDSLGGARLPAYVRVDVGVRSRWQLRVAGRTTELAVFGTVTNILAHRNVLTTAPDPNSRTASPIMMRPRAPLVIGIDWAF